MVNRSEHVVTLTVRNINLTRGLTMMNCVVAVKLHRGIVEALTLPRTSNLELSSLHEPVSLDSIVENY